MPGRQSHGAALSRKPKARTKSKKRTLDAFAIASYQNPDRIKVRQNRLGASEGGKRPNKRQRIEDIGDEDEENAEQSTKRQRKGPEKGRFDELDVDEGSDSEGNEWKLGHVDSDDDSDIDSDEAFGESDEEKFDGYAFSVSTDTKPKKVAATRNMNLDEDEVDDGDDDVDSDDEDDLGDDAIDLAAMLDTTEEGVLTSNERNYQSGEESGLEDESEDGERDSDDKDIEGSDEDSSASSVEDASNPAKLAALQSMVADLPQNDRSSKSKGETQNVGVRDSSMKLTMDDVGLGPTTGVAVKRSAKERKRRALEIPLDKRQQDRLDRSAAFEKTKETLDRWTDTVKHNRRAEHLMFPLPDNDVSSAKSNNKLQPTSISKPFNELEATIQSILEESGLATASGQYNEDRIREFEALQTNKMSIEEVKARRDQLRIARELLFREEVKAKRIKKIKSKSYRKVHRKQREKEERMNKEALAEGGFEPSEDELEAQNRRRATERMGQKHRGSKWAKSTKESGRAAWDEDARAGITDMARRDEELRKRVDGQMVRREIGTNSGESSGESDHYDSSDDDRGSRNRRLLKKLETFSNSAVTDSTAPLSKLVNMKFMLKAESSRKKENDEMVEEMRREIAGESPQSGDEDIDIGRRTFGQGRDQKHQASTAKESELEEPEYSGSGKDESSLWQHGENGVNAIPFQAHKEGTHKIANCQKALFSQPKQNDASEGGAWSKAIPKSSLSNSAETNRRRNNNATEVEELDLSKATMIATRPKTKKPVKNPTIPEISGDEDSDDEHAVELPFAVRDQELIKRAFAGADVVGEFESEKRQTVIDEDEKIIDNTLPGWGNWTGEGLSKREKARNKGRFLTKLEGIKERNRKDAKLDRVIINEKRVKKNVKYLASSLPHTFESKQQYERSLRMPIGPEWATKETVQGNTKPRILLKQGIIMPISRPLI